MKNLKTSKDLSVKISPELYFIIKEISIVEGKKIKFLIDKAVRNYLVSRKILDIKTKPLKG